MISIKNISKSFDQIQALNRVSFRVPQGELCGLLGPNGAGKTTLFNIMMGLLAPDQGELYIRAKHVDFGEFAYKQDIGYALETPALYEYLTGSEFLNFIAIAKNMPVAKRLDEILEWLSFFNLDEKANELIKTYSHGMRRKTSLIAALIGSPKILLLDEATNGLDPETSYKFKNYLRQYSSAGGTVIFSSHIIETIENLCDRVLILDKGEILRDVPANEWQQPSEPDITLENIFLKVIEQRRKVAVT